MSDDKKDAERYRKLRALHWTDASLVVTSAQQVNLGAYCPSGELLDDAIDQLPDVQKTEPVSSEPIPPQIQSQASAMTWDAGMID